MHPSELITHPESHCDGLPCCIHNPTCHHMRFWKQDYRDDILVMERVCAHDIGHPDPDHLAFIEREFGELFARIESVHECDGCCACSG